MQIHCFPHPKLNNPCCFRCIFKTNWFSVLNSKSVLLTKLAFSPTSCLIMSKSFQFQDLNLSPIKSEQCDQAYVPQTVWQSIISDVWILWSIVQLLCVNTDKCSTFFLWKHVWNPQLAHCEPHAMTMISGNMERTQTWESELIQTLSILLSGCEPTGHLLSHPELQLVFDF